MSTRGVSNVPTLHVSSFPLEGGTFSPEDRIEEQVERMFRVQGIEGGQTRAIYIERHSSRELSRVRVNALAITVFLLFIASTFHNWKSEGEYSASFFCKTFVWLFFGSVLGLLASRVYLLVVQPKRQILHVPVSSPSLGAHELTDLQAGRDFNPPPIGVIREIPRSYAVGPVTTVECYASQALLPLYKKTVINVEKAPKTPTDPSLLGTTQHPGVLLQDINLLREALESLVQENLDALIDAFRKNLNAKGFNPDATLRNQEFALICQKFKQALHLCPEDRKTKLVKLFSHLLGECKVGCDMILDYEIIPCATSNRKYEDPIAFSVLSTLDWRRQVVREVTMSFANKMCPYNAELRTMLQENPELLKHGIQLLNRNFGLGEQTAIERGFLSEFFDLGYGEIWRECEREGHQRAYNIDALKLVLITNYLAMPEDYREPLLDGIVQIYRELLEMQHVPLHPDILQVRMLCKELQGANQNDPRLRYESLIRFKEAFEYLGVPFKRLSAAGTFVSLVHSEVEVTNILYNKLAHQARQVKIIEQSPKALIKAVQKILDSSTIHRDLQEAYDKYQKWKTTAPKDRLRTLVEWGYLASYDEVNEFVILTEERESEISCSMLKKRLTVAEGEHAQLGKTALLLLLTLSGDLYTTSRDSSFVPALLRGFADYSKRKFFKEERGSSTIRR